MTKRCGLISANGKLFLGRYRAKRLKISEGVTTTSDECNLVEWILSPFEAHGYKQ